MFEFMRFHLPSGHVYEVPLRAIADDRARYCHENYPNEFPALDAAREDSMAFFAKNADEAREWALDHMDLIQHARLVAFKPPVLEWSIADVTYHEERAVAASVTGDTILSSPVDLVFESMAEECNLCDVHMLMDPSTGLPMHAIAFITGGPMVVGAFASGMQQITSFVTAMAQQQGDAAAVSGAQH